VIDERDVMSFAPICVRQRVIVTVRLLSPLALRCACSEQGITARKCPRFPRHCYPLGFHGQARTIHLKYANKLTSKRLFAKQIPGAIDGLAIA